MCEAEIGKTSTLQHRGGIRKLPQLVQMDFEDGSTLVAPEGAIAIKGGGFASEIGDIVTFVCKIFPAACGGGGGGEGGGGGGGGCYTIIGPDRTKITICPPNAHANA